MKYYASELFAILRRRGVLPFIWALRRSSANNAELGFRNAGKYLVGGVAWRARCRVYRRIHDYLHPMPPCPDHLQAFAESCMDPFALQTLEMTSTNLPVLLRYADKNAGANSIEARMPFLDHRAVEIALSLPGYYKIRDGWSKWLLRKGMSGRMPDKITWRRNKYGFEAPDDIWLDRHGPEMKRAVLGSELLASMTRTERLRRKYHRLDRNSQWRLYSIALWEAASGVSV